jgi:hypothetical protein
MGETETHGSKRSNRPQFNNMKIDKHHVNARTLAAAVVVSLVVVSVTAPLAAAAGATTVSLALADASVGVGNTTTVEVVVDSATGGVGAAEFRIAVDDPSVARITDVTVLGSGATRVNVSANGSWVDVEYAFRDTADSGSITVAEVTVERIATGEAELTLDPAAGNDAVLIFDENGTGYDVEVGTPATLTVTPGPSKVVDGPDAGVPTDPDGDDRYEDVDGSGTFDIFDVAAFLSTFDREVVQEQRTYFDFTGDGSVNIFDVAGLLMDL